MRKNQFLFLLLILISGLLFVQCGGDQTEGQGDNKENQSDSTEAAKDKQDNKDEDLVPVEVTTVRQGDISSFLLLSSNLETEIMADVYSRIQGIVEKIHKEEGDYVKKGDTMIALEAQEYVLAERRAYVEYQKQQNNHGRLKAMHEQSLLSDEEFESARYALETAELQWKEAKLNLDYTFIKAPISGRVGERSVKIGKRIQPTDMLYSVVNTSEMIAVLFVPEKNLGQLRIGQRAIIFSDNLENTEFSGVIKRISPVVDPASGTFKVTVGVRDRSNRLRPGMFVNVRIIVDTHEDVTLVPKTAVVYENEYMNVYVVRDSVAHKIRLKPGFEDHEKIESTEDVEPGDKIIVVGQAGMKDQTRVNIVSERIMKEAKHSE